ncbi:MAG: hypothetical protein Q8O74_09085 [bacterium]|nr:hypothetical protein [bacterium]
MFGKGSDPCCIAKILKNIEIGFSEKAALTKLSAAFLFDNHTVFAVSLKVIKGNSNYLQSFRR